MSDVTMITDIVVKIVSDYELLKGPKTGAKSVKTAKTTAP